MSYTYAITPAAMFEDRFEQFVTLGIPRVDVTAMRDAIFATGVGGLRPWHSSCEDGLWTPPLVTPTRLFANAV